MTGTGVTPAEAARDSHAALVGRYWGRWRRLFRTADRPPWRGCLRWQYWWQAQALDTVVDAVRRGDPGQRRLLHQLIGGIQRRNGGRVINDYYDDMAWLALALDRAGQVAGEPVEPLVARLWREIQGGWNPTYGGIIWRRGDTYTNTPANAPAAILAARRYRATGDEADLEWARRITGWLWEHLVDAGTGVVWDGIQAAPGARPNTARYSYNQGTVTGAELELARITGDGEHRRRALLVAAVPLEEAGPGGILPDEGGGDRALFKGIYARYAAATGDPGILAGLARNAHAAWEHRSPAGLSGPSWSQPPTAAVQLSAQLSAVMLFGALDATGMQRW